MAIQDALHRRLVEAGYGHLVGTKIGCTTPVMQEFLGMPHPCAGGIFDSTVRFQDGSFDFDSFLHVGVECEIAVKLGTAICASDVPHTRDSVSHAVSALFAAIEIVDDRYVDFGKRRALPVRRDLQEALEAVLAGEPIAEPRVPGVGCFIPDVP